MRQQESGGGKSMEPGRVRAQLDRMLASAVFSSAERASSLLRFIVECALDGRASDIKESIVAIEVLGRSPSFDSKTDPIVRVEAARLRDRLREYYDRHGVGDDVLISVPKGGYVPEFAEREPRAQLQPMLRLSVLPPNDADFDAFVISPDARRIAFTAVLGGSTMLWLREIDSLDASALAGTELAACPFWSPDSRSIGFFTPFKLKVVPASGGPPKEITDVVLGRGAAWSRDGVIVFCPRPEGPLHQIPADGGPPRPVTVLDSTRSEVFHGFPHFLPDGRRFLYFAASHRPGESSIKIASLDSDKSTPIVSSDTSAVYAPLFGGRSGCLLFVSHDSLLAQPLDPQAFELRGRADIVVSDVRYRRWGQASVSISPDGLLLYRSGTNERHQFTWLDRQGMPISTIGPLNRFASHPHYSFNLSPDGRRVAVHRHDDPDSALATIWIMDLYRGGALWRFTEPVGGKAEFCPVWRSNGTELAFSRGDDRAMLVLCKSLRGANPTAVVDTTGPKFPTDWSDDSRFVAYNSQEPDYRYQHLWIAPLSGADVPHQFLNQTYHAGSARFAPTGGAAPRWLAYTSNETGRFEIYIRSFPDESRKWQISDEGGVLPQWRRDGRELFYLAPDGTLMAVAVDPDAAEFHAPQKLFATGLRLNPYSMWVNQYAVANDGQSVLVNRLVEPPSAAITALIVR